tara:strand:- start:1529 stop:1945 length:417 start_codon:yes stop_codon:yes gene_type:complete
MEFLNKYRFNGKKRLFLFLGIINFLITNFFLHMALLFFPILFSTILSQTINFLLGFYLYGKKVFKIKKLTRRNLRNYLFLALSILNINFFSILLLSSIGINKNLAAIYVVPFLVIISYFVQNNLIFSKKEQNSFRDVK